MTATVATSTAPERPVVKTITRELTYFDARCVVVTEHHDKRRDGLRTVTMTWLDQADARNGGHPAGTVERRVIEGDGRRVDGTFIVHEHEVTHPGVTTLVAGRRYVGTTTGKLRGERFYRDVEFIAARDQDVEPFIRDRETTPNQDRVFEAYEDFGSVPRLFVTGSIREVA